MAVAHRPRGDVLPGHGAPAVAPIAVGLVKVPIELSQAKTEASLEFPWSMSVLALAYPPADLTLPPSIGLPCTAVSPRLTGCA